MIEGKGGWKGISKLKIGQNLLYIYIYSKRLLFCFPELQKTHLKMFGKRCKLYIRFINWPFNKFDFKWSADNP